MLLQPTVEVIQQAPMSEMTPDDSKKTLMLMNRLYERALHDIGTSNDHK
jgi:hypothetical protein